MKVSDPGRAVARRAVSGSRQTGASSGADGVAWGAAGGASEARKRGSGGQFSINDVVLQRHCDSADRQHWIEQPFRPPREISTDRWLISPARAESRLDCAKKLRMTFEGLSEALKRIGTGRRLA